MIHNLGRALEDLGMYEEAAEALERALSVLTTVRGADDPMSTRVRVRLDQLRNR